MIQSPPSIAERKKISFTILDSIRGIAALYVAIAHCRGTLWMGGNEFTKLFPRNTWDTWDYVVFGSSMLTRLAVEFVIVFFVLSGFSIAHSLSSNKSPVQFYKRRLIRIYPSYLAALLWAGLIFVITRYFYPEWYDGTYTEFAFSRTMEMNDYLKPSVAVKNVLYMPMHGFISPFWSLTYEVIFYLLAPFLLRKVHLYALVSSLLFLVNFLIPQKVQSLGLPVYFYDFLFVYNIYFVLGVLLYTHYEKVAAFFTSFSKSSLLLILTGNIILLYAVNIYFQTETVYSFIVSALLGFMLIVYFLKYQVRIPWLMKIGKYSYTLYITHFASVYLYLAIYWSISGFRAPYIINYFIWIPAVFFVLLMAYIQYYLVEKRTQKVLGALRKK